MNQRYLELLYLLDDSKYITSNELAEQLSISNKTVQKLLKELVDVLPEKGASIEIKHRQGYRLQVYDKTAFSAFLSMGSVAIPMTNEDRTRYILKRLTEQEYIRSSELEEELYISRGTLQQAIKQVKKILEDNYLRLESRPRYGLYIEGTEFFKRRFLTNYFNPEQHLFQEDNEEVLGIIAELVKNLLKEKQFSISDFALNNLIIHLYIAMERIRNDQYISEETIELEELLDSYEYHLAELIVQELEKKVNFKFPKPEIAYVTIHLAGKRMQDENQTSNVVISQHLSEIVDELIEEVYQKTQMDFRGDVELKMALGLHLIALETRSKYKMELKNPLLAEVKKEYPTAYAIAVEASAVLNKRFDTRLSEHEIGYIAFSFALSIERQKRAFPKKNILLVCATGKGSAKLLQYKYRKEFGEYIDQLKCCDVTELSNIDFSDIDYVISTVPITVSIPRPILEVQYFLDAKDIGELRSALFEVEEAQDALEFYDERLFIPHLVADTRQEAIDKICEHISKYYDLPTNFRELVYEREASARTEFGNSVAMPHPNENVVEKTFACIAILNNPIIWEEKKVQVIFLIAIEKNLKKSIQAFYQATASFLLNKECIKGLIKTRDFKWFQEKMNQQEG